jgi:hypothetical protein
MTQKTLSKSLIVATVLGIGMMVAPGLASAGDSPAKIEPADPAVLAQYGGGNLPMLSSSGEVVTGNAWCDPISDQCLQHPWMHPMRATGKSGQSDK